jgi:hypothetical protein
MSLTSLLGDIHDATRSPNLSITSLYPSLPSMAPSDHLFLRSALGNAHTTRFLVRSSCTSLVTPLALSKASVPFRSFRSFSFSADDSARPAYSCTGHSFTVPQCIEEFHYPFPFESSSEPRESLRFPRVLSSVPVCMALASIAPKCRQDVGSANGFRPSLWRWSSRSCSCSPLSS